MPTNQEISETADKAADILETQGHTKFDWGEDGGPRCLGGAMAQASNTSHAYVVTAEAVEDMIGGGRNFVTWNNEPERTPEEVIGLLRDVATKYRSDEMRSA